MPNLRTMVEGWDTDERGEFPVEDYLSEDLTTSRYSDMLDRIEILYRFKRSHDKAAEGPIETHVMRWLENVTVAERPLYLLLASRIMFYTLEELRILAKLAAIELAKSRLSATTEEELVDWLRVHAMFVPMSDSGVILVRELRHSFGLHEHMCPMSLESAQEHIVQAADVVVMVDDFIGTGLDVVDRNIDFERALAGLGARPPEYLCTVATEDGCARVEREAQTKVHVGELLTNQHKVFDEDSEVLPESLERGMLKASCAHRGASLLPVEHALGFGGCQLALVMPDNVPDNTLPVIWRQNDTWRALYPRDMRKA